ncbi:MAG: hypothetical protein WCI74_17480 [Actinomycetes bacterium]
MVKLRRVVFVLFVGVVMVGLQRGVFAEANVCSTSGLCSGASCTSAGGNYACDGCSGFAWCTLLAAQCTGGGVYSCDNGKFTCFYDGGSCNLNE